MIFYFDEQQKKTAEFVMHAAPQARASQLYISGPSAAVDALSAELTNTHGIPEGQLKKDWFTGRFALEM